MGVETLLIVKIMLLYYIKPLLSKKLKNSLRFCLHGAASEHGQDNLSFVSNQIQSSQLSGIQEPTSP